MKKWNIANPDEKISRQLTTGSDLTSLCADVLVSRGIKDLKSAAELLSAQTLESPFCMKDAEKAAEIINNAVEEEKRICIYGDYDCDGITSTVILYSYLETMGADVHYYIPERCEGYGLNKDAVKKIYEDKTDLIITVDNGISACEEIDLIKDLGMSVVVTDHHQPPEIIPAADAVVNPHQSDCESKFKYLCGAGVALKLCAALDGGDYDSVLEQFGDIAAIGTIADVVELSGENRYIVEYGLKVLLNTERCGLIELLKCAGLCDEEGNISKISATDAAFKIAPRINASGRFGSPKQAFELLMCDDPEKAAELANELNRLNSERKSTEDVIIDEISDLINSDASVLSQRVLVFSGAGWHHGVIGIVAARIEEKYGKPCFIITVEDDEARGSARSFGDFSVFDCLTYCSDVLTRFGGHKGAGGFSLKTSDIDRFKQMIGDFSLKNFEKMPVMSLDAVKVLKPTDITPANVEGLKVLEPFGEGNPQPMFVMKNAVISCIIPLSGGVHTKLMLDYGGYNFPALIFRTKPSELPIKNGETWDFLITLEINEYNGRKSVSLFVADYRKSGLNEDSFFAAGLAYDKYIRKEEMPEAYYQRMCPDRNDLVAVYSAIGNETTSVFPLFIKLTKNKINFCKLKICLDIFRELGLLKIDYAKDEVKKPENIRKADLENSNILRELRSKWGMKAVQ